MKPEKAWERSLMHIAVHFAALFQSIRRTSCEVTESCTFVPFSPVVRASLVLETVLHISMPLRAEPLKSYEGVRALVQSANREVTPKGPCRYSHPEVDKI